jgi:fibronectin-binding autotransporter adhesin
MKWQNWLQNLAQRTRTSSIRGRRRKGRAQHTAGWYRRAALNSPTELLEQKAMLTANAILSIVASATPSEGDGTVTLTVTLTGAGVLDNDVTVNAAAIAGTATGGGTDYSDTLGGDVVGGVITFGAGTDTSTSPTMDIEVTLSDDNRLESDEGFTVDLSGLAFSGDMIVLGNDQATVTINDNESATVSLDATGADALTEAAGGTQTADVSATLTITASGTGTVGSDVTVTAGLGGNADFMTTADASFGPGDYTSDTQNITISATNDNRLEATTEIFAGQTVSVTSDGGADVSEDLGNSRTVTVDDNESATVSIGTATVGVTEGGATANVPVTLDLTTDGTGTAGIDVTVSVGLTTNADFTDADASFTPGDGDPQMQNIVLTAVNDRLLETITENFAGQTLADLSTGGAAVSIAGGSGSYQVNVTDNENAEISVVYSDVNEGGGVQTVATVTLTIFSSGSGSIQLGDGIAITADVTDAGGGSAVDTTDYATPGTQTVTFDSNAATGSMRTASLNPVADRRVEGDESVNLALGNLSAGGTNTTLTGTLTGSPDILDDDTATVTFDNATSDVDEEDVDHVIGVTLTISASGSVGDVGLDRSVSVDVTDAGTGTAVNGTAVNNDFTFTSPTTLTFNPFNGVSTAMDSVTLNIREDIVDDDAETIDLAVAINTDNTGGQVMAADAHEVTINDDDSATDAIFEFPADGGADTVRVVNNGGTLEIYVGATLVTSRSFASITNLTFTGADGEDDTLEIDLTGGDVIPSGGISYSGGAGGNDSLVVTGGAQGTVTYNYTNANDGDIVMSAFGTVTYTGLEPITNTGTATDVIFNLPDGTPNADAVLQNNATAGSNELTGSTFENTVFTNPSNSLTINLGDMGDTFAVNTLDTSYAASLIINGGAAGTDQVDMTNVNIDTNDGGRGLQVTEVETLNITGGTITDNDAGAGDGGGVLIVNSTSGTDTTATLDGVTISNNTTSGAGGGLANDGATVIIQNGSMITGNESTGDNGGGIDNGVTGTLTIDGSTISGNTADGDGGGINDDGGTVVVRNGSLITLNTASNGDGGGIDSEGPLTIDGSTISNNDANEDGGGIWSDGGLTLQNTVVISGNDAGVSGGGLYLDGSITTTGATITISNNTASGGAAVEGGGGIYNNGQTLTLDGDDTISGNSADGTSGSGGGVFNDGGTLNFNGTTIDDNEASRAGGGIEATAGSTTTLTNIMLTNNIAGTGVSSVANPGNGGGFHATGNATVNIDGGTITGNDADSEGGGLWNGSGIMTISDTSGNVLIDSNTASGIAADNGGGGIFNSAGGTIIIQDNNANTVTISNNVADGTEGSGGGIFNDGGGTLTITGAVIDNNSANRAGGGIEDNSGAGLGVMLTNVTLSNNDVDGGAGAPAPGNGGGLHVTGVGDVVIDGGSITNNNARTEGGGLWIGSGLLTISDTAGSVLIDGNTASGNAANDGGGGIFSAGGDVMIQDNEGGNAVTISNNVADGTSGSGGGILIDTGGTLTATGAIIDGNSANRAGGGIEDNSGAGLGVTLTNVSLTNNDVDGGAGTPNPGNGGRAD